MKILDKRHCEEEILTAKDAKRREVGLSFILHQKRMRYSQLRQEANDLAVPVFASFAVRIPGYEE